MIDRILVAAYDAGLEPLLVLTKADLAAPDELMATYRPLGVPVVAVEPGSDLDRAARGPRRPPQRARRPLRASASRPWSTR